MLISTNWVPFRWTPTLGLQSLGLPPGVENVFPSATSSDGSVAVGRLGRVGQPSTAFYWTAATGFVDLGTWNGNDTRATSISRDGLVVLVVASHASAGPISLRWDATAGFVPIAGNIESAVRGCNDDGDIAVGDSGGSSSGWRWDRHATDGYVGLLTSCGGGTNSTGAVATMRGSGVAALSANRVTLHAEELPPGSFGFFLTSRQVTSAPVVPPGSQGAICLSGAIGRYVGPGQVLQAGPSGEFSLAIDLLQMPQPSSTVAFAIGETWHFQAWFRDAIPAPTSNFSRTLLLPMYY